VPGARRGARVKSIAIACRKPWVHVFKPILLLALDEFFKTPVLEVIVKAFDALNSLNLPYLPTLSFAQKKVMRTFIRNKVAHFDNDFIINLEKMSEWNPDDLPLDIVHKPMEIEMPVFYSDVTLPIKIPTGTYDSEIGDFSLLALMNLLRDMQITNLSSSLKWKNDVQYLYHPHLDLGSSHPLIILLFALLTEKRVLFIGHGRPCREVGNCVLSCVAIAAGGDLIPGTVERCFPYTSLANLDNLLQT
jgi:hypothetical protein